MLQRILLSLFIGCLPQQLSPNHRPRLIIWDVGQGQWITLSHSHFCWHFDMGGEKFPKQSLLKECLHKKNYVSYSHWDWDHIGLSKKALRTLPSLCMVHPPLGPTTAKKSRFLLQISKCRPPSKKVTAIELLDQEAKGLAKTKVRLSLSNLISRIYIVHQKILLPGDSPKEAERFWLRRLPQKQKITWLIAGHHGSHTSTSAHLLKSLSSLKGAVASARKRRYGHPHEKTSFSLRKKGIPILSTNDWGHIAIPL